mgnify:CR=1 FL=1
MSASGSLKPGQVVLGRYALGEHLGKGAFGTVWLADDRTLRRRVALKFVEPHKLAQLRDEAATLAQLDHPNIVKVWDVSLDPEAPALIMEYVEGESLRARMVREGVLAVEDAVGIACSVLGALDHAHGKGILHRDIKPENILLSGDGLTKLGDFGLGKMTEAEISLVRLNYPELERGDKSVAGTLAYMAPEQMEGAEDARSDVYSVGVLLYELLVGERPMGVFDPPAAENPAVSPEVNDAVLRALQMRPDRRYQSAGEMAEALGVAPAESWMVVGEPATPESPEERMRKALRAALADGTVSSDERIEVERLRRELGLSTEVARRLLEEARAETAAAGGDTSASGAGNAVKGGDSRQGGVAVERETHLRRLLRIDPADASARRELGLLLVTSNPSQAERLLRESVTDPVSDAEAGRALAECCTAQGRHGEALALCRSLASSERTPESIAEFLESMACAGKAYLESGDVERAASLLSELEELEAPSALTEGLCAGLRLAHQSALRERALDALAAGDLALARKSIDEFEDLAGPPDLVDDLTSRLRDATEASSEVLVEQAMEATSESVLVEVEEELVRLRQVADSQTIGRGAEVAVAEARLRLAVARVREAMASPGQARLPEALEHLRCLPGGRSLANELEADAEELRRRAVGALTQGFGQALDRRDLASAEAVVEALRAWGCPDELLPGWEARLSVVRTAQEAHDALAAGDLRSARVQIDELAHLGAPSPLVDDLMAQLEREVGKAEKLLLAQAETAASLLALERVERCLADLRSLVGDEAACPGVAGAVVATRVRLWVERSRAAMQSPGQPNLEKALEGLRSIPAGADLAVGLATEARRVRERAIECLIGDWSLTDLLELRDPPKSHDRTACLLEWGRRSEELSLSLLFMDSVPSRSALDRLVLALGSACAEAVRQRRLEDASNMIHELRSLWAEPSMVEQLASTVRTGYLEEGYAAVAQDDLVGATQALVALCAVPTPLSVTCSFAQSVLLASEHQLEAEEQESPDAEEPSEVEDAAADRLQCVDRLAVCPSRRERLLATRGARRRELVRAELRGGFKDHSGQAVSSHGPEETPNAALEGAVAWGLERDGRWDEAIGVRLRLAVSERTPGSRARLARCLARAVRSFADDPWEGTSACQWLAAVVDAWGGLSRALLLSPSDDGGSVGGGYGLEAL